MQVMSRRAPIGDLWNSIQSWLFPLLEDELGELDEKHRQFVSVCELCAPQDHMASYQWCGNGCPPSDRLALCKAFIAKAVWDFSTTRDLIDAIRHRPALRRLCGWEALGEVPSESTFSRAFDQFSSDNRPQAIHEALIKTHYGEKIAGHISRDATAIHAREKATAKPQEKSESKPGTESKGGKRGHRRKDDPPAPPPEPKRLQQQLGRNLEANLDDLPKNCDWVCKKNSQSKSASSISTTWLTPRTTPRKSARCPPAWDMSPSSTTIRGGARNASSRPPKPCATANAARSNGSTPICTSSTEGGMFMSEARLKWPLTWPSA
jgi:hypothetical protein